MARKNIIKLADDVTFEQNFFQLAFAYIRDKIPNLLDYMLGFEVVNKNEDGTQAVGLFKFDISGRELFVPIFYKNGELKGAELLYNQNQDQFVPNKENWVDTILNARPEELGVPSELNKGEIMAGMQSGMDLSKIYNPTQNTKFSMDRMQNLSSQFNIDFKKFLKTANCKFAEIYTKTLMHNPELHKVAIEAYGSELYECLKGCKQSETIVLDNNKVPEVEVIDVHGPQDVLNSITDSEKQELIEEGVVLRDNRKNLGRISYKIEGPMALNACNCAGLYSVLMPGGSVDKMAVIPSAVSGCSYTSSNCVESVIIAVGEGKSDRVESSKVFSLGASMPGSDFKAFVDKLKSVDSAKTEAPSKNYDLNKKGNFNVFVEADGSQAAGPCTLENAVVSGDVTTYSVFGLPCCDKIVVSPSYRRMKMFDRTLYVPKTAKVHTFSDNRYRSKIELGGARDIDARIKGLNDQVKVSKDRIGFRVLINGKTVFKEASKRDAYVGLVAGFGMSILEAKSALKSAAALEDVVLYFEKKAQPFFDPGMVATPNVPSAPMGINPTLGVAEQYPQADTVSATSGQPGDVLNQRIMDSITGMGQGQQGLNQQSVDRIMQAAQSGEQNVFDVANISELINRADIDTPLDQYMADLQTALDRLGRIYFLMLFHGDKFSERFSQEDLPSMEESVRNTFLNLGELILKLKERKIEADSGSAVETDLNQLV